MGVNSHSFVLFNDGTVMGFGYNEDGELGLGDNISRNIPTLIPNLSNAKQISGGGYHSLVLLNDGTVKAFGMNSNGELGLDNTIDKNIPTLSTLSNVKQIVGSNCFSLALLNDGTVMGFGWNANGELGLGNVDTPYMSPTLIPSLTNVKQIACGNSHSLVLLNDGTVMVFGNNTYGQLGLGNTANSTSPTLIPNLTNVKQIACGVFHSLVLLNDGTVKAFGFNAAGQLGLGNTTTPYTTPTLIPNITNVKQIEGGGYHSLILLNDGTVMGFGYNNNGQLGLGNVTTPYTTPTLIPNLSNVKQISCGIYHSLVLLNDGTVKVWGYNNDGELGLGDTTQLTTPTLIPNLSNVSQISCGSYHSLVLLGDASFPDDIDIYVESEKEFSKYDDINKLLEWKRCNTLRAIDNTQKGLVPQFLNINWRKTDTYFKNGVYAVSRDYFETCIHANGILNNIFQRSDISRFFCEKMDIGYAHGIFKPFLLFINKVHIAWSRITIIKSDFNISLLISGMDKELYIEDLQILAIPFNVIYTEDEDEQPDKRMLYRFNKTGAYSYDTSIFVYADNDRIQTKLYIEARYDNYDMCISSNRKLTENNLIVFDETGRLERGVSISIKNTNLLTVDKSFNITRYISCCYNTESNVNEANSLRCVNEEFEKQLLDGSIGFEELDQSVLLSDFDFGHDKTLPYSTNIANSLNYVFGYDENKFDPIFESIKPVNIVQYNISDIVRRHNTSADGSISMLKDIYDGDNLETFPIIFHNGMVPAYYKDMEYNQNSFTFNPSGINYSDTFEIAYFKKANNTLIKIDLANKSEDGYLNINDYYIPKEDIVVYSACRGESNLFPLNYVIDSGDNIVLKNSKYLDGQLYIGSKNQFLYESFIPTATTTIITLSDKFRTAYNEKKFMVFVNGRYLNSGFYKILIPSINNSKITERAIYTMKTLSPTDRVDIFYCSVPKMTRINANGDLLIQCIKSKATINNQSRFEVPYPFSNYPKNYDSFFCIKNSTYVDKSEYIIDGDYIQFIDAEDYSALAGDLIFVFPYYKPDGMADTQVDPSSALDFISRYTRTTADTDTIVFTPDYHGSVIEKSTVHIFNNSTYIDPSRYELIGNDTIKFTGETIAEDTMITMVIETDEDQFINDNIRIEVVPVIADIDNQYIFNIPNPEYHDSFFIMMGSVLVSPDRYFIAEESKVIFINSFDRMPLGKKLLFVFAKDKADSTDPDNLIHIKTEFVYFKPDVDCTSIPLSSSYCSGFKFNKENLLLFVNSVYTSNDRFTVTDNVLSLTSSGDVFKAGKSIVVVLAYRNVGNANYTPVDTVINPRDTIKFQDIDVVIQSDGQEKYIIPYPNPIFTDTAFMLSIGNTILNPESYTVNDSILTILDTTNIKINHKLRFTFVHNNGFTYISKSQISVTVAPSQTEIDIPSPYYNLVNLNNRMILTYGNVYVDKDRYIIDSTTKKIILIDFPITDSNRTITFTFFFTGTEYNGAIAYLPESGYMCFPRKELTNNLNKEMYMMFINGKKICKSELIDVSNDLVKVSVDVHRRYDLVLLNCSPTITELKSRYNTGSNWSKMLEPLPI